MIQRLLPPLTILLLAATCALAEYEYRYIEGEAFNRGETEGLRDEGFVPWMAHPSGGKVAVMGRPHGGFLEYDMEGLQDGEYWIHVRCLALPITKTHVLWDGQDLGLIAHDAVATSLRWSLKLGPVQGAGKHVLRLQGSDDTTQWPYIDVILLTNVKEYAPPGKDQDFVSYRTPWPLLELKGEQESQWVAPLPAEKPGPMLPLRIVSIAMRPPVLGRNDGDLVLLADEAMEVERNAAFTRIIEPPPGPAGNLAPLPLTPDTPRNVHLTAYAESSGLRLLGLYIGAGDTAMTAQYPVEIPKVAAVALDEYAYPSTQRTGRWQAAFSCDEETLHMLTADVTIKDVQSGKMVFRQALPAQRQLEVPFDLVALPVGRFSMGTEFLVNDRLVQSESREFIKYNPVAFPVFEPVRDARAVGDTITVNGKPFLARMIYHAPVTEDIVNHGFNIVQCHGSDPDPLPSIQKHLDDCQQVGLYGAVALFNNTYFNKGAEFDLAHLEEAVLRFKDHPALLCWDLIDEPDVTMTPEAVQAGADLIRRLDPNHFVWVNLCQYPKASDYLASQDLWSYDYYPFPQMTPFDYKARWLDITDRDLLGKRPLGTCLQTFNYNRHEQRMPTPDELRTSAWLHVIHGYKWFGYYSYYDGEPAGCLDRDPMLYSYTRALNTELTQLQDVILAPGQWKDVPMTPATQKLEAREKEVGGKLYVVIVSDSREPLTVTLSPSWANARRRLLIESEMKSVGGKFETTVRPVATQVWELTR